MATAYGRTKPYIAHARYHPDGGWLRGWGGKRRKGTSQWVQHHARPCPDCNGTGRDIREAARLVLDATWRVNTDLSKPAKFGRAKCSGCGYGIATTRTGLIRSHGGAGPNGRCSGSKQRPDTAARDHVDVCATKLQTLGDPLGEWLALWLSGKRDNTAGAVKHLHTVTLQHEIMNYPGQPDDRVDEWRLNRRMP